MLETRVIQTSLRHRTLHAHSSRDRHLHARRDTVENTRLRSYTLPSVPWGQAEETLPATAELYAGRGTPPAHHQLPMLTHRHRSHALVPLAILATGVLFAPHHACAQPTPDTTEHARTSGRSPSAAGALARLVPEATFLQIGKGDSTHTFIAGLQWLGERRLRVSEAAIARLYLEIAAGRWQSGRPDERGSWWVSQATLAPAARIEFASSPVYVDAGVGPSWVAPLYQNGRKRFSTKFNFRSHLAVGARLPGPVEHDLSLRLEHLSNAGIRRPNPGVNLFAVRYTRRF